MEKLIQFLKRLDLTLMEMTRHPIEFVNQSMQNKYPCRKTNVKLREGKRIIVKVRASGHEFGWQTEVRCDLVVYSIYEERRLVSPIDFRKIRGNFLYDYYVTRDIILRDSKNWVRNLDSLDEYELNREISDFVYHVRNDIPELIEAVDIGLVDRVVMD